MIYMVCYDISNPRRLRRTAKVLEGYGMRVQKSFFQCDMSRDQLQVLIKRILKIIDRKHDALFVYPLCEQCSRTAWRDGTGEILVIKSFEIL